MPPSTPHHSLISRDSSERLLATAGFSMHPVESTIYLSSCLFPALFLAQHPIHFLFKKFYTSISP